jgi:hypothetical protein
MTVPADLDASDLIHVAAAFFIRPLPRHCVHFLRWLFDFLKPRAIAAGATSVKTSSGLFIAIIIKVSP